MSTILDGIRKELARAAASIELARAEFKKIDVGEPLGTAWEAEEPTPEQHEQLIRSTLQVVERALRSKDAKWRVSQSREARHSPVDGRLTRASEATLVLSVQYRVEDIKEVDDDND